MTRPRSTKFFREVLKAARTTAFRLSLLFTLVASIITGASMVMIYQTARQEISEQIDSRLFAEALRLKHYYEYRTALDLYAPVVGLTERVQTEPAMSYCLTQQPANGEARDQRNMVMLDTSFSDLCMLKWQQSTSYFNGQALNVNVPVTNDDRQRMRVLMMPLNNGYSLAIGYDTHNERMILARMLNMALFVTGILILASFFGSFFISHVITTSTQRISRTARRIVDGDFSERILVKPKDSNELRNLAGDLNHMLDKIETLITSQRQVTNNIAHDLRSPLNRLRSRMEVALLDRNRSRDELREVIGESIEDAQNLLKTFNALLNIAQVEARARDDFEQTNITHICEDLSEMYEVLTEEGTHNFSSSVEPNLEIMGNRQLIAQAITNLLDNAVKYTPQGGAITLEAFHRHKHIVIAVSDNGKGIPEADFDRVLRRFVRLDSARSTPGNGLGLSLVNAVVTLHGGTITLKDNKPGLRIELEFPNASAFQARLSKKRLTQHHENT